VKSEEDRGTTFRIYLPGCRAEVTGSHSRPPQLIRGSEKVLLVDDEEMVLEVGHRILAAMGYSVCMAKTGKEAIRLYRDQCDSIDLVLLDMVMPDMCGAETYDRLKAINPEVKVLLSSGFSIDGQAAEILKRGCNGFIQKPFNIAQISQKLRDILSHTSSGDLSGGLS